MCINVLFNSIHRNFVTTQLDPFAHIRKEFTTLILDNHKMADELIANPKYKCLSNKWINESFKMKIPDWL